MRAYGIAMHSSGSIAVSSAGLGGSGHGQLDSSIKAVERRQLGWLTDGGAILCSTVGLLKRR